MLGIWRAKVVASGKVYTEDLETLEDAKQWATMKLAELGHTAPVQWKDRDRSSVAVPGTGLELHVTRRD